MQIIVADGVVPCLKKPSEAVDCGWVAVFRGPNSGSCWTEPVLV